jgi:phosphate acetyltransferase
MARAIFLAPTSEGVGLTSVALGVLHALDRRGVPVAFCKPITQQAPGESGPDRATLLLQHISGLTPPEPVVVEGGACSSLP